MTNTLNTPRDYEWMGQVEQQLRAAPQQPNTGRAFEEATREALRNNLSGPTIHSNITRLDVENLHGRLTVRDNQGNEIHHKNGNIPAITCDGKAQTINPQNAARLAQQALSQLPPQVLDNALSATRNNTATPNFSASITYEGASPLTHLCNAGKATGVLER